VRLLIDANLSPKVAAALCKAGLESVHVGDVGLLAAPDRSILDYAAANALVIVSANSDFGELLATSGDCNLAVDNYPARVRNRAPSPGHNSSEPIPVNRGMIKVSGLRGQPQMRSGELILIRVADQSWR
jgi:hypothetical protein